MERPSDGLPPQEIMPKWQRTILFFAGVALIMVPVTTHAAAVFGMTGAHEESMVTLGIDALFVFFGLLFMVPRLAVRVARMALVWRKK